MNNTFHMFHSASVLRIFDCIGIESKEIPTPLKSNLFKINNKQDIWGGFIELEPSIYTLLFYSEIEEIKYVVAVLKNYDVYNSFFIVCGDALGDNVESNIILTEYKMLEKAHVAPLSCFDVCRCVQGFEIIKDKVGSIIPIQSNIDKVLNKEDFDNLIKKIINVGNKIILEDLEV